MKLTKRLVRSACYETWRKLTAHGRRKLMAMEPTMYRRLDKGEIIKSGDECDVCRDGWRDETRWELVTRTIGQQAPDPAYPSHSQYRRWTGGTP